MTRIADELRSSPRHVEVDDQIAFCQLQRVRVPGLTKQQWLDLFELWRDHYQSRQEAEAVEKRARVAKFWQERDALFSARAALPPQ
jgi:hypothetical protein